MQILSIIKRNLYMGIIGIFASCFSTNLFATGLFIPLQSTSEQGNARAGGAAIAEDASNSYYNAAAISRVTRLYGSQLNVSVSGLQSYSRFFGTMQNTGFQGLSPITETGTASTTPSSVLPSIYYVRKLTDKLSFGMAATTVYGLGLNYPSDSILRYAIIYSNQHSTDLGPSLSYQITPKLALALGPDILYYALDRKTAVRTEPLTNVDGYITASVSAVTPGWHAGLLYEFTPATRVGLSYRSQFIVHLTGDSNAYTSEPNSQLVVPTNRSTNTTIIVPLASLTVLSAYHDVTPLWAIMASVEYMNWGIYENDHAYRVASPLGGTTDSIIERDLHDTLRYAVGTSYLFRPNLLLRTGLGLNPGATNNGTRKVTLIDPDNVSLAFGAHYQYSKKIGFDGAYSHVFQTSATINDVNATTGNTITGHTNTSSDAVSFQVNWNIG